jgi:pimeloyl-ACP methyl ester carboxylesterase
MNSTAELLDPRERHFRTAGFPEQLSLFLRHLPPVRSPERRAVLYVHGGTFPSALSIAHRFDSRSWRDDLADAGFDVWGLDFLGFGLSDRYPEMSEPAERHPPLCCAEDASRQIENAVRFILAQQGIERLSLIAHSWGTIATGAFAARCPELVDRLVLFGPITWRAKQAEPAPFPAWRLVSLQAQWDRFTADVPQGEPPVLLRAHFDEWGERYLDTDPENRTRSPAAVKIPSGPWQDIADAWAGRLGYDPAMIRAPVAIIRGEWDSLATDADARWLFDALRNTPVRRDVKIARATHLMHLEQARTQLYAETRSFLTE